MTAKKKSEKPATHKSYTNLEIIHHPERFGYLARIEHVDRYGNRMVANPVTYRPVKLGETLKDYGRCFDLETTDAQNLMNNLWRFGIRPESRYTLGDMLEMQSEVMADVRDLKKVLKDIGPMDPKNSGMRGKILRWLLKKLKALEDR